MKEENQIYLSEEQAHQRYSMSRAWFQRCRWRGDGPIYVKLGVRILYPKQSTDQWFAERIKQSGKKTDAK